MSQTRGSRSASRTPPDSGEGSSAQILDMMVQMQAQMGSLQGSVAALQRQRDADAEAAAASAALASLASSQQQVPQVQAIQLATGAPAAQATPPTPARAVPTPLRYPPGLQQPRPAVDPLQPAAVQPSFQEVDGVRSNAQAIVRDPTAAPSDREAAAAWLAADAAQWLDEEEEHENEARWSALHGVVDPSATHERRPTTRSSSRTRSRATRCTCPTGRTTPSGCVARQPGASTTLKPTSTFKRAVYHA